MFKDAKKRRLLIAGIAAAILLLAGVLILVLTQCAGSGSNSGTTAPAGPQYFWNLDRAQFAGQSEAGLSSREPDEKGVFSVRFFKGGKIETHKTTDRALINQIDTQYVMGLVFDKEGNITDIIPIDQMEDVSTLGWQFYTSRYIDGELTLNSSSSFNGMEEIVSVPSEAGIWDMSGKSGELGIAATPIGQDRVMVIADKNGTVLDIFLYERMDYMPTHDGYCEHCKKDVSWKEWDRPDTLPTSVGHYQLQANLTVKGQQNIESGMKVCLDLNGYRIDGAADKRVYSLHNAGATLVIMDTSASKTGTIAAHGTGDQGMCVWARYGEIYLYNGILDGSDAASTISGTTVALSANTSMVMHGGEIIGGLSKYRYNEADKKYSEGLGGAMIVTRGARFTMHGGLIRDGEAETCITKTNGSGTPTAFSRGFGGNLFCGDGSVTVINGGTITNGRAGNTGGNIYLDGTASLTINGGTVKNGVVYNNGRNGGNIVVSTNATFTMNGGTIEGGTTSNCAGNVYLNGTVTINGGTIIGGICLDYKTGKANESHTSRNIFNVNGTLILNGGTVEGSIACTDTVKNAIKTRVVVSGAPIVSGPEGMPNLYLNNSSGDGIILEINALTSGAKIGLSSNRNITSLETVESNLQYFFSDDVKRKVSFAENCIRLR